MSANQAEQAAACRTFRLLLPSLFQLYSHSFHIVKIKKTSHTLTRSFFTENAAAFFLFVFR